MRWTDLFAALSAAIWLLLLVSGVGGLIDIMAQNVPGYPVAGQWILYMAIPATAVSLVVAAVALSRGAAWFRDFYPVAVFVLIVGILPIMFVWGGGV